MSLNHINVKRLSASSARNYFILVNDENLCNNLYKNKNNSVALKFNIPINII